MKKFISLLLIGVLVLGLVGCNNSKSTANSKAATTKKEEKKKKKKINLKPRI